MEKSCKECKKRTIVGTADLGGKFYCVQCGRLVTGVSTIGHGLVCFECNQKGFCQWCGKKIEPEMRYTNMKFKTLKDLLDSDGYRAIIMYSDLKTAAIEHYKELILYADSDVTDWIKEFFNLTEEGLS